MGFWLQKAEQITHTGEWLIHDWEFVFESLSFLLFFFLWMLFTRWQFQISPYCTENLKKGYTIEIEPLSLVY